MTSGFRCSALALVGFNLGGMSPAPAQNAPVVVAILPFEDRGSYGQEKEVYRALELGIPATIAAELSSHSELRLADPNRVARLLGTSKVGARARLDAATAARIGKETGARYAITGTFADFYGKFRLEARIVDTESGQIVKVVTNKDPSLQDRRDLYRIVQQVGHQVLAQASTARSGSPPLDADTRIIPTEALTEYSLGLLYERQGDAGKASQHFNRALSAFPNYPEAREGAQRVRSP
ncbi:MAG TPA: tetratricopeptide repeat protein [Gemmatimonadales bacterium]|nr:tetratricopeptide repeat protein [Gemmatimonadales bacterium]